jgi:hypothetical protein
VGLQGLWGLPRLWGLRWLQRLRGLRRVVGAALPEEVAEAAALAAR